ncbi:MAG TPA: hypothetical protein VNP94_04285 [Actinomycetota bacterium]|nr:hypothetical protein [Actinomycetota bacterium]
MRRWRRRRGRGSVTFCDRCGTVCDERCRRELARRRLAAPGFEPRPRFP